MAHLVLPSRATTIFGNQHVQQDSNCNYLTVLRAKTTKGSVIFSTLLYSSEMIFQRTTDFRRRLLMKTEHRMFRHHLWTVRYTWYSKPQILYYNIVDVCVMNNFHAKIVWWCQQWILIVCEEQRFQESQFHIDILLKVIYATYRRSLPVWSSHCKSSGIRWQRNSGRNIY